METIVVKPEMDECLQRIAIEIFNDCVNAGQPFQVALAAIYMSGLSNAHDILAEARSKEAPTPLERWDDPHA